MKELFVLLFLLHVSSSVKHSLKFFLTASSEVPDFPRLIAVAVVDNIHAGYCDTNLNTVEPKQEWMKRILNDDPKHMEWYTRECTENQPNLLKDNIDSLKQRFNQSGGAHILQRMSGCEFDSETQNVTTGFMQYGYDGEDFIVLDLDRLTWVAPKQPAVIIKDIWNKDEGRIERNEHFFTQNCPKYLKKYLEYGKSSLLRTVRPSVSLLQKTPSSRVTCHATGFYPEEGVMFWRKDGVELLDDMYRREVLPNHDGTFQMSVHLNISSILAENWGRYECVFQLSGVEDIVTKLEEAAIRTNHRHGKGKLLTIYLSIAAGIAVFVIFIIVLIAFRRMKENCTSSKNCASPTPDSASVSLTSGD